MVVAWEIQIGWLPWPFRCVICWRNLKLQVRSNLCIVLLNIHQQFWVLELNKKKSLKICLDLLRPFKNVMTWGKAGRSLYCIACLIVGSNKRRFWQEMFLVVSSRRWTWGEGKQQICEQSCCQASRRVTQTSCEWKWSLYSFLWRSAVPAEAGCRCAAMSANTYFTDV